MKKKGGNTRLNPSIGMLRDIIEFLRIVNVKPTNGIFTWNNKYVEKSYKKEIRYILILLLLDGRQLVD